MQSTSKKKTINYREEQRFDLPFYSKEEKDRKVNNRLIATKPNPKITGYQDGKSTLRINQRSIQADARPNQSRAKSRVAKMEQVDSLESPLQTRVCQVRLRSRGSHSNWAHLFLDQNPLP